MTEKKQYIAFISYNHHDVKWAKWLRRRLEWYRLPAEIHNEYSDSRYLRPVFRDRDTLTSGVLNDSLRQHLEASQHLVVICSPHSAQSQWVSDEVKAFIEMGRMDCIVPFIVEGSPNDYSHSNPAQPLMGECFPLALRQWNTDHPDQNLLGIAINDDGRTDRNRAFIRLVAHILGLEFDSLWQRHKRFVRRLSTAVAAFTLLLLALAYWFIIPVRVSVEVRNETSALPGMEHGVLTFNGSDYSINHPDTTLYLSSLPGYYRLHNIPLTFRADRFYEDETQVLSVGVGMRQHFVLQLHRDSTFAVFGGTVYDGDFEDFMAHPVSGATVSLGSRSAVTDDFGRFRIVFPLKEQRENQPLKITHTEFHPYMREDESPGIGGKYLLKRLNAISPS